MIQLTICYCLVNSQEAAVHHALHSYFIPQHSKYIGPHNQCVKPSEEWEGLVEYLQIYSGFLAF